MTLETILRTVLHAAAWSAFVAFCGVVATVGVCSMLRLLCHALAETGRTCGKFVAMTLASVALVCAVVGGGKALNGPPDGVSAPARVMSAPRLSAQRSAIAPETCLQGPANAPETLPPHLAALGSAANAQDVPRWELRGAYDDAIRIPAEGWDFRMTNGFIEGMTVLSRGEFRPDVGHLYFPRPFTNDLALLPQSRWGLLPGGGESKLWYAATPSNSLLVTWVNGLLDRNPLTPTNFQAEFFPDGSYEYRYGDHSEPHPFVLPFDLDGDGLENSVDPDPETAGPDAHNTNAEWCNVVCSNILSTVEGDSFTWRSGVNSNAYYFVEVIVPRGPAPVYFVADGPSDLGNPVIVATAGATSRVPLLIGATYAVTSDTPFTVSVPDASDIAISPTGATSYLVRWPIIFEDAVTEVDGHSVHAFTPSSDLGGTFNWSVSSGGTSSDPGPSLMSGTPSGGCGFTSTGNQAWFACAQENCGCGGCTADGTYDYEGYRCVAASFSCGCHHDGPPEPQPPEPVHGSVSASFTKSALFFEEAYANTPDETPSGAHHTETILNLSVNGGDFGGRYSFTLTGGDKIGKISGDDLPADSEEIGKGQSRSWRIVYGPSLVSSRADDIVVTANFTDNDSGAQPPVTASATVLKVEIGADNRKLLEGMPHRHRFGVGETIVCTIKPNGVPVTLSGGGGGAWSGQGASGVHTNAMPYVNSMESRPLTVTSGTADFTVPLQCLVPEDIFAYSYETGYCGGTTGTAGYVALRCDLELLPRTVSFRNISVREIPATGVSSDGSHTDYFNQEYFRVDWYHTVDHGAGRWWKVHDANLLVSDMATRAKPCPRPWGAGTLSWSNPIAWRPNSETNSGDTADRVFCAKPQVFTFDARGVLKVEKFGHSAERSADGGYWCDGAYNQWLSNEEKGMGHD